MVPSQAFAFRRTMLDERFYGDDDFIGNWACSALRLGNQQVSASYGHDSGFSGNDAEQHFLGKS